MATDRSDYVTKLEAKRASVMLMEMPDGSYRLWVEDNERRVELHLAHDTPISVRVVPESQQTTY